MKKAIIILTILTAAHAARADYHYASHEGSNEYPYTSWATAANVIQDAVDAAESGDTVFVGEGVWNDTIRIWTNNLALIGMGMYNTTLQNNTDNIIRIYSDTVLVKGFSIIGAGPNWPFYGLSSAFHGYIDVQENYFNEWDVAIEGNMAGIIHNNIFEHNGSALFIIAVRESLIFKYNTIINSHIVGPIYWDDWMHDGSKSHINNNLILNTYGGNWIFDFMYAGDDSIFIHNNLIARKYGDYPDQPGYGYYGHAEDNILFYNNTIDGTSIGYRHPQYYDTGIMVDRPDTARVVFNNIITNCEVGARHIGETPTTIEYTDFFNISVDYVHGQIVLGEGCLFVDPMFADTLDFHLQAYSPAIDAGDPTILDPDGSRSDMGAYGGPYGESYLYLDLPPRRPDSLRAEISAGRDTIYLSWLQNTEADFNRYQIHRDTISGFEPSVFNLVAEPDTSFYADVNFSVSHSYHYRISAVDNQENVSEYSEELSVVFTSVEDGFDSGPPRLPVLRQNYPNPFNQRTLITYYLPAVGRQPAQVQILICDILGRRVRMLVIEDQYPGEYRVRWDGMDNDGNIMPSGVYFCRILISGSDLTNPRKLLLIK
jgi:hypothetical protein